MKIKLFGLLAVSLLCGTVFAGWPTVEQAGFKHCALIYEAETRTENDFKPMLAYNVYRTNEYENRWLFDSFLFLTQRIDGVRTENGTTTKALWIRMIDHWFDESRDVPALNGALQALKRELKAEPLHKIKVMFCIPWLSPAVTDFGDVDADGISEDLSKPEDAKKVLQWYLTELQTRLEKYPDLELWGLYWMREDIHADAVNLKSASDLLHRQNLRFLWIPWFRAANWNNWKNFGFDVAIMQSNYAFTSRFMNGNSRRNRLDLCADLCLNNDMGVEIEFPYDQNQGNLDIILQTYEAGSRWGFQFAPTAYFFSYYFNQYCSDQPEIREIYEKTADYISGEKIVLKRKDNWDIFCNGNNLEATVKFDAPEKVDLIDIMLTEEPEAFWRGTVMVEARDSDDENWRTIANATRGLTDETESTASKLSKLVAWTVRGGFMTTNSKFQNITLEIFDEAAEYRISMISASNSEKPNVTDIFIDSHALRPEVSKIFRADYQSNLPKNVPTYGDNPQNNKLIDGVVNGPWANFVGWHSGDIVIQLYAPKVKYDEVRVYSCNIEGAAIYWPGNIMAMTSALAPVSGANGFGAEPPEDLLTLTASGPVIESENAEKWQYGYYSCKADKVIDNPNITVSAIATSWGFISEIALYKNGEKVRVPHLNYHFLTAPGVLQGGSGDDGRKLTNGIIAKSDSKEQIVTIPANTPVELVFDLLNQPELKQVQLIMHKIVPDCVVSVELANGQKYEAKQNKAGFAVEFPAVKTAVLTVRMTAVPQEQQISEVLAY